MSNENIFKEVFPEVKKIYDSLMDEKSQQIFGLRLLYNLTKDYNYLLDMISYISEFDSSKNEVFSEFYNSYKKISKEYPKSKFIIYGAGKYGNYIYDLFSNLNWYCFCDKDTNKQKENYCGLKVISPEELISNHKEDFVVIGTLDYENEIHNELISMGFPDDHILSGNLDFKFEILFDKQYFENNLILPQENEIFVDAGCFNCETSLLFKKWSNGKYEKIYAFEPDRSNYEKCKKVIKQENIKNIELFNAGLWNKKEVLHFNSEANSSSRIIENGDYNVNVISLDEVLNGEKATFIKMDIEGAELEALKGAKKTIVTYRPRLAICIYHKPEDILEIPLYLQSLVPDYKFYIRHYSNHAIETVLYAI